MTANTVRKQIIRWSKKAKASFNAKEVFVFLLFYLLATLMWFLYKTSQFQEVNLEIPVVFTGIPSNIQIDNKIPDHLTVTFKDKGSALLSYLFHQKLDPLHINLSKQFDTNRHVVILTNAFEKKIRAQLRSSVGMIVLSPDSIIIEFTKLYVKQLPVVFTGSIEPAQQYMLSDSIQLFPNKIAVFGQRTTLDTMRAIYTQPIRLINVRDTMNITCQLNVPKSVRVDIPVIKVKANVEPFTEKKFEVPIEAMNMPKNLTLRTFPSSVTIVCLVGISHFNEINKEDYHAIIDYKTLNPQQDKKATVQIIGPTLKIPHCQVVPETVDYLLESNNSK
ncbi:MAG: CdaR family protein [Microbacter sp.]